VILRHYNSLINNNLINYKMLQTMQIYRIYIINIQNKFCINIYRIKCQI